jgi:hypothetical protein
MARIYNGAAKQPGQDVGVKYVSVSIVTIQGILEHYCV